MTPTRGYRVAELAATVGVNPDTIRYYEKAGLLLARRGPRPDIGSMRLTQWTGCGSSKGHNVWV